MPSTSNDRVQHLETELGRLATNLCTVSDRIQNALERIAKVEGMQEGSGDNGRRSTQNVVLGSVLSAVLLYLGWVGYATYENAVSIAEIRQASTRNTQTGIDDALKGARTTGAAGDTSSANAYLAAAKLGIESLRRQRIKSSPYFFSQTVEGLSNLKDLAAGPSLVTDTLASLAAYRSQSLTDSAILREQDSERLISVEVSSDTTTADALAKRGFTVLTATNANLELIVPDRSPRSTQAYARVSDLVLDERHQELSGLSLHNIIFLNTHITFDGSRPALLDHVIFLNCTFSNEQPVRPLLEYAALAKSGLLQLS